MPPSYPSGEAIRKGDRIRYGGDAAVVDFVADADAPDDATTWYIEQFGGGCMIVTEQWGRIFLHETEDEEDLELVSRSQ